jgi:hypothetical protein
LRENYWNAIAEVARLEGLRGSVGAESAPELVQSLAAQPPGSGVCHLNGWCVLLPAISQGAADPAPLILPVLPALA